jgi:hypothetical protein
MNVHFVSLILLWLLFVLAPLRAQTSKGCTLSLDVLPVQSSWTLSGRVKYNNTESIAVSSTVTEIGAQGRLFLLTTGACPTTVVSASTLLTGGSFSAPQPYDIVDLRFWPTEIQSTVEELGRIDLRSVEWQLKSEKLDGLALQTNNSKGPLYQVCES